MTKQLIEIATLSTVMNMHIQSNMIIYVAGEDKFYLPGPNMSILNAVTKTVTQMLDTGGLAELAEVVVP